MNVISAFDLSIEQALYAVRDPSLTEFFFRVTQLGNVATVFLLMLIVAMFLAYHKRWALVAGLCTSVLGTSLIVSFIKGMVARPRPLPPLPAYTESAWALSSFPSLHAAFSVAFYVFAMWLIYGALPAVWRGVAVTVTTGLVLSIGFSRLYLGVHYPSDVLAGYILGSFFAYAGILVARKLAQG